MLELRRNLSRIGFPQFEITVTGKIYRVGTDERVDRPCDMGTPSGSELRMVDSYNRSIPISYLDIILAEENKDLTPTELANKYNFNLRTVKHYKHVLKHPKK